MNMFVWTTFAAFMMIDWIDERFLNLYENEPHAIHAFAFYFLLSIPASLLMVLVTTLLAAALGVVAWRPVGRAPVSIWYSSTPRL